MIQGKASLKTETDNTSAVLMSLKGLADIDVLVGVPEENTRRDDEEITNAELINIHTHGVASQSIKQSKKKGVKYNAALSTYITSKGSPLWRIPPRPLIEPALEADGNKQRIEEDLKIVAQCMLDGNKKGVVRALNKAGIDGVNIIRDWFEDPRNNWPPPSDASVRANVNKKYKSKRERRATMKRYREGLEPGLKQLLVDTDQMRKAISYVIRFEE
jgi:hypothetical protein